MGSPRLLVIFTVATGVVVVAFVALIVLGSWWVFAGALLVHLVATLLVLGSITKRTAEMDKPDPITEARLEEEERTRAGGGSSEAGEGQAEKDEDRRFAI